MKRLRILSAVTTAATFALVAVGGAVRATGSGLGCPGWPKCYGHWFPPFGQHGSALEHALIEYSHRFLTSLVVALIAWLVIEAWRRGGAGRRAGVRAGGTAAMVLILVQAGLGAAVVKSELNPVLVTVHYANAMLLVAALVFATVAAFVDLRGYRAEGAKRRFAGHALGVTLATYVLIILGTYVRGRNAGLVFSDWPLMGGRAVPDFSIPLAAVQFAHRFAALLVFAGIAALTALAWGRERDRPPVRTFALLSGGLFVVQILAGAALIWTHLSPGSRVAHETIGSLVWGALVATTVLAYRLRPARRDEPVVDLEPPGMARAPIAGGSGGVALATAPALTEAEVAAPPAPPEPRARPAWLEHAGAYLALTKPRIIVLLLITTVPAMILAAEGWPSTALVLATLFGGTLAAGSANAINCYIDRDIDELMRRTRRRPLPAHRVDPRRALAFGVALGVASFVFLALTVNVLAASLALAANVFYVFVYTLGMKRHTPQNIVIGGAAGAMPVLVGWAAVTGRVGLPAVIMFLIVFYWTPPHFWALSIRYEADYRAAGVPMLPVVRGLDETTRQILLYSMLLFAVTLLLYPIARLGALYLAAAVALGVWLLWDAVRLRRLRTVPNAMRLFHHSNTYLALLFAAVAADPLVHAVH
ncbi:MAG TPA: heme o synthase [Actinomycetota bacterium]